MKSILLLNPCCIKPAISPIGLEYIAEDLRNNGYKADILDLGVEKTPNKALRRKIKNKQYFAIGVDVRNIDDTLIHVQDFFLPEIRKLICQIRKMTKTPIIIGGAGFSISPKAILEYLGADYGIEGYGIPGLRVLLKKIENNNIKPGSVFRFDSDAYLDVTFKRNTLPLKKYYRQGAAIGVNTKSGCLLRCIYCTYPKVSGYKLYLRDPRKVIAEIENLSKQGITRIFFTDSVFNIPPKHAKEICEQIIRKHLHFRWYAFLKPSRKYFTEDLLRIMIKSGLVAAQLGIDSGSERILKVYKKNFTVNDIEHATKLCKKLGLKVGYSVLFGAPGETKHTIDETFSLIDRLKPDYVDIETSIRIYKPTGIARIAERKGIIKKSDDLIRPIFYPFKLRRYVTNEAKKRTICHLCFTNKPVYKQLEK